MWIYKVKERRTGDSRCKALGIAEPLEIDTEDEMRDGHGFCCFAKKEFE